MVNTYWEKSTKVWVAYWSDHLGPVGDAQMAQTKEIACWELGLEMGRRPEKFARPLGELMAHEELMAEKA